MERGMRWTRRARARCRGGSTGARRRPAPAQAPPPRSSTPTSRSARPSSGSASRSRWPSSATTTSWCSRRHAAASSGSGTARSAATVLDLAVNSSLRARAARHRAAPEVPAATAGSTCSGARARTGADSTALDGVRLMGNRIDRFEWDDGQLEFDRNIIKFRAFQQDAGQPLRGNHDGGVHPLRARRQAVRDRRRHRPPRQHAEPRRRARSRRRLPDDQFGGPETDDLHRTGVIVRLDEDGDAPRDNPFWRAGRTMGGEVGENVQKLFAYGIRNSFGMAFDPKSGDLWEQENGDDSFSELNRVPAGHELRLGPDRWARSSRVAQFKQIETDDGPRPFAPTATRLQQIRWPPTNIADTPQQALDAHVHAPGRVLQRPGVELEVRGRRPAASASWTPTGSGASTRTTCSWAARPRPAWRAATCSAST